MWYSIELTLPSRRCIKIISAFEPNLKYLHVTIIAAGVLKGDGVVGGLVGVKRKTGFLEMLFTLRGSNSKATLISCLFFLGQYHSRYRKAPTAVLLKPNNLTGAKTAFLSLKSTTSTPYCLYKIPPPTSPGWWKARELGNTLKPLSVKKELHFSKIWSITRLDQQLFPE